MYRAYILSKSARSPRFRAERETWVQRVIADGHAICILPERSPAAPQSEDHRSSAPAAMETMLAAHWKTSSRAAMSEDDACSLGPGVKKCNPRNLSPDTAYTRQSRRGCVVEGACAANNAKREEPYVLQDAGDNN